MIPGEILDPADGEGDNSGEGGGAMLLLNQGRPTLSLDVANDGDRPIQVGSHYHFAEANEALTFDRAAARGFRLDIAAGTAVRFEPGIPMTVNLVALGGSRIVAGLRGLVAGPLDGPETTEDDNG